MANKDNFKSFVSKHPTLSDYVEKGDMTWQKFYELFDLYGEDNAVWDKYLNEKTDNRFKKEDIVGELTSLFKGIDLDSIQNHVNNAQKAISIIQELTKKSPEVITKVENPLTKFYGD